MAKPTMVAKRVFAIGIALATLSLASVAHAADDVSRIPRIGFQNVMRVSADGLCARVADAIVEREKIKLGDPDTAQAILAVRRIKAEAFPKRIGSVKELLARLSDAGEKCSSEQLSEDSAVLLYERKQDGSVLRVLKYALGDCQLWDRDLRCGGFVYAAGALTLQFTRGSIKTGLRQLADGFGLRPGSAKQMFLSPEQQRLFNDDPDSPALPSGFFIRYFFRVEPRQEEPWAFILNRLPYIEDAARTPQTVAGIDTQRMFQADEAVNRLRRSPMGNAAIPTVNAQSRSMAFLREWFEKRGGVLKIVKQDDNRVRVRVDRLRGEVIGNEKFWEYLNINLVLIEDQSQTKFYLINDGYYAAGVGSNVPPDASFIDMERDYYSNLVEYTEVLATQIESRIKGPQ